MQLDDVLTRRRTIAVGAISLCAAALAPRLALATEADVAAELKALYAGRPRAEGRIRIGIPPIIENGLTVPLDVDVESPMTEADHVKALHVFAEGNPLPHVLTYRFTPASGKASASTRIRLARTQTVVCVAEMSDGQLFIAKTDVQVTIGGCGG